MSSLVRNTAWLRFLGPCLAAALSSACTTRVAARGSISSAAMGVNDRPGRVAGDVLAPDGKGVPRAIVALIVVSDTFSESADTALKVVESDAEGRFSVALPPGRYTVSATDPAFTAGLITTTVTANAVTSVHVRLTTGVARRIHGTIKDTTGHALANVRVRATAWTFPDKLIYYAYSDAAGQYAFRLPPQEAYDIVVEPGEYASFDRVHSGVADGTVDLVAFRWRDVLEPAPQSVLQWIRSTAIPLASCAPDEARLGDLAPLRTALANARVIAVGEATHGTREFFQLKQRVLQFAVADLGVSAFLMEADFAEAMQMNDYVLYGRGDVRALLPTLRTELFDTAEYLALFQWMRQYNADPRHARKIRFYGIDMQSTPLAAKGVSAYVARVAPLQRANVEQWLAPFASREAFRRYKHATRPVQEVAKRDIEHVLQFFDDDRTALINASSEHDWAVAQHLAWVIAQAAAEFSPPDEMSSDEVRDTAMAKNVEWVLAREGASARVVLSAHNGHIARAGYQGIAKMGWHLARLLGDQYYAIGTSFLEGSFGAYDGKPDAISRGIVSFSVPPPKPYFFETTLVKAVDKPFFLDLRKMPSSAEARRWMAIPRPMRTFGAVYSGTDGAYPLAVWQDQFDGLLEVPETTAALLLTRSH